MGIVDGLLVHRSIVFRENVRFSVKNSRVKKISRSTVLLALMLILSVQAPEQTGATSRIEPEKTFAELEIAILELDLALYAGRISPYQRALIHFWRGEYPQLLDVDTFIISYRSWQQGNADAAGDLVYLSDSTRGFYVDELTMRIQNAELPLREKEFLKLFLYYILNEGENAYIRTSELNALADRYLTTYPGSPYSQFVQGYVVTELPPLFWTLGASMFAVAPFLFGDISSYFSLWPFGMAVDFSLVYRNFVAIPSVAITAGSITSPFSYEGKDWSDSYGSLRIDLSLGYRIGLSPKFTITPKGGLGLLSLWEHPESEGDSIDTVLGFTPTASAGIMLTYISNFLVVLRARFTLGVDYRVLIHPWEDRFSGSELMILLGASLISKRVYPAEH